MMLNKRFLQRYKKKVTVYLFGDIFQKQKGAGMHLYCMVCKEPIEVNETQLEEVFIPADLCFCQKCFEEGAIDSENELFDNLSFFPKISYHELREKRRQEIEKHRWYESERAGHDIEFHAAKTDWKKKYEEEFLKKWGYA